MAQKQIFHVSEDCKKYQQFLEEFEEKSEERLRYYAAKGEELMYLGMWRLETPRPWISHVFLAMDGKTEVFLSMRKTVFVTPRVVGERYLVKEDKSKIYVLE